MYYFLFSCTLVVLLGLCHSAENTVPDGRTITEFAHTVGLSKSRYEGLCKMTMELNELLYKHNYKIKYEVREWLPAYQHREKRDPCDPFVGNVIVDEDLAKTWLHELKKSSHGLMKRGAPTTSNKWPRDMRKFKYFIHDSLDSVAKYSIKKAIDDIEDNTCLEFEETNKITSSNVMFTAEVVVTDTGYGCFSYIGKAPGVHFGQPIILSNFNCYRNVGIVTGLIAQFLGMVPEHMRPDRNEHITINMGAVPPIIPYASTSFPYDIQSVTHKPGSRSSRNELFTSTIPPGYESNLGQSSELSFWDIRTLNTMFCGQCDTSEDCLHSGFRRIHGCDGEKDCCEEDCQCPDGLKGFQCDEPEDHNDDSCKPDDDNILIARSKYEVDKPQCIEVKDYERGDKCTWLIKNGEVYDPKCKITFWIDGDANIEADNIHPPACNSWLEVRLCGPDTPGQRLCGLSPKFTDLDGKEGKYARTSACSVLVNFRSFKSPQAPDDDKEFKGLKLCYYRSCGFSVYPDNFCSPAN